MSVETKDRSMLLQKEMIAAHYRRLEQAPETGEPVVYTFVPGNLTELDAPRSRRANASTPIPSNTAATNATGSSEVQSYWPASGRWSAVHDHGVRLAIARTTGGDS